MKTARVHSSVYSILNYLFENKLQVLEANTESVNKTEIIQCQDCLHDNISQGTELYTCKMTDYVQSVLTFTVHLT